MVFVNEERRPLHPADWVIIAVYFLACIIVGLWVSLKLFSSFVRHVSNSHKGTYSEVAPLIYSRRFAKRSFRSNSNDRSSEYLPAWLMQIFKFCKVSTVSLDSICLSVAAKISFNSRKKIAWQRNGRRNEGSSTMRVKTVSFLRLRGNLE